MFGVEIFDIAGAGDDLGEIGCEVGFRNRTLENVRPRQARFEYRWDGQLFSLYMDSVVTRLDADGTVVKPAACPRRW